MVFDAVLLLRAGLGGWGIGAGDGRATLLLVRHGVWGAGRLGVEDDGLRDEDGSEYWLAATGRKGVEGLSQCTRTWTSFAVRKD